MSQKSSVMQLPQFVPKALTSDRSLLQPFLSLLAPIKKGPNLFEHTHGEYGIVKNYQILYCDFEVT